MELNVRITFVDNSEEQVVSDVQSIERTDMKLNVGVHDGKEVLLIRYRDVRGYHRAALYVVCDVKAIELFWR